MKEKLIIYLKEHWRVLAIVSCILLAFYSLGFLQGFDYQTESSNSTTTAIQVVGTDYRLDSLESRQDQMDKNFLTLVDVFNGITHPDIAGKADKSETAILNSQLSALQAKVDQMLLDSKYTQEKISYLVNLIDDYHSTDNVTATDNTTATDNSS